MAMRASRSPTSCLLRGWMFFLACRRSKVTAMPVLGRASVCDWASRRQRKAFARFVERCVEGGELREVEGKIALLEFRPPIRDHRGEERTVFARAADIVLALIPDRPADGVGDDGVRHAIEGVHEEGRCWATTSRGFIPFGVPSSGVAFGSSLAGFAAGAFFCSGKPRAMPGGDPAPVSHRFSTVENAGSLARDSALIREDL